MNLELYAVLTLRVSEKSVKTLEEILEAVGHSSRIVYSLDRFQAALASLGNPEKNAQTLVIAGTNGKGTTSLFLSSALREAGHKVSTFLSPHLQSPTERFLMNLSPIKEEALRGLAEEHLEVGRRFELTYFEFLTLLFFVWNKREKTDFAVIECGMGGRLDSTNVTDPLACIVTNIGYDHQQYLGNTLEAILDEKMGIFRPESLVFTGIREQGLLDRVEKRCLELDAVYYFAKELRTEVVSAKPEGQEIRINGYTFLLKNPSVGTVQNAELAFLTMRIVFPRLPIELLSRAFEKVVTPGRMEIVQENPRVILSGDHNMEGIQCLKETLARIGVEMPHIVCAFSPDKPWREMYRELSRLSSKITLTAVPRFEYPPEYSSMGYFVADPRQAVEEAMKQSKEIVVTGSLYLVGEVREAFDLENSSQS
jgi:dihydrofolate synthase / folylpolyglutamate synthase